MCVCVGVSLCECMGDVHLLMVCHGEHFHVLVKNTLCECEYELQSSSVHCLRISGVSVSWCACVCLPNYIPEIKR